jgi:glycerol-3-phosphate dehydrogenase
VSGEQQVRDLVVIGGGINGAGIACDAAGRGLSVLLCEKDDLASATSSASSKLIHGGLRYLEHYEFRLVRKALIEREVLLAKAPHIIHPMSFVMPLPETSRPAWLIRLGLFLYDHLARHPRLPNSKSLDLKNHPAGRSLKTAISKGFSYADCQVDDARLVVLNARAAADHGAEICTRTEMISARRKDGLWEVQLHDRTNDKTETVRARALVNAAGPWVESVLHDVAGTASGNRVRLVKGSHIVVPRLYTESHACILQHTDDRVVFVIPFEDQYSLIGTTDVAHSSDPGTASISDEEIEYLCDVVNCYFEKPVSPENVIWSYAGVRPLFDDEETDPSKITRDYVLELDQQSGGAPLLSVFGGKVTTYRKLAEEALATLKNHFPHMKAPWTDFAPLPGGDIPDEDMDVCLANLVTRYPDLEPQYLRQLVRRHGTLIDQVLTDAECPSDLGTDFGNGLTAREVDYLVEHEWALTAEDILWRRTKAGLGMTDDQRGAVKLYLEAQTA